MDNNRLMLIDIFILLYLCICVCVRAKIGFFFLTTSNKRFESPDSNVVKRENNKHIYFRKEEYIYTHTYIKNFINKIIRTLDFLHPDLYMV